MMNDLDVMGDVNLWKYVDDSTLSEVINKHSTSAMQDYVNEFALKYTANGMQLKESKCKELRIGFSTTKIDFDPIIINDREIEVVPQAKLLGPTISNDLKWNSHVKNICEKASTRLYFLRQLKRANVPSKHLLLFYVTCIRPVVEYACEVFHDSLPAYLSDDLERLQKRACRIILPDHRYNEAMDQLGLVTLAARRQILTNKLFKTIVNDPDNKLYDLLPPVNSSEIYLRGRRMFQIPSFKTNRFRNDFINCNSCKYVIESN